MVLNYVIVSRSYQVYEAAAFMLPYQAMWSQRCHTGCAVYDEETDEASTDPSDCGIATLETVKSGLPMIAIWIDVFAGTFRDRSVGVVLAWRSIMLSWAGSRRCRCFHLKSSSQRHGMNSIYLRYT